MGLLNYGVMGHYTDFKAKDFALNESFQKWVLSPDDETDGFWSKWMVDNPHKRKEINEAVKLVKFAGLSTDHEANRAYLEVWENLRTHAVETTNTKSVRIGNFSRYAYLAAAIAGILVISIYFLRPGTEESIEYKTAYGEIREVVLSDGSKVVLNANSSIKVSEQWRGENDREVILRGEAFFSVVKTKDKKAFNVKTPSGITVQVLGTEFNVSTRREQVEVYLQSGKVKVNSLGGEVTLKPGDFIVYQNDTQSLELRPNGLPETRNVLGWKSNYYIFNDTPLSEIVKTLEDDYGFAVVIQNKALDQKKITAKISRKDINVLLNVLSETLNIKIEQDGNRLTFTD